MAKRAKRSRSKKAGLPPGTLMYLGESGGAQPSIYVVAFDDKNFEQTQVATIDEALQFRSKARNIWINIDGIHDALIVKKVGETFNLHPLILEDVMNPNQRPKKEDFEGLVYLVARALTLVGANNALEAEQVSLVLGQNFLISFQERPGDIFESVRQRFLNGGGRLRQLGCDYLLYALLDRIVDGYFGVMEEMGEKLERLETELINSPTPSTLQTLHRLKRDGLFLRRAIWPLREVISGLDRQDTPLMGRSTLIYLRDVYDHTVQVIDTVESYREMLSGMLDIYLSSLSNKMNTVMKVLTIFASIFMPLTFIAGIYGMNFRHMPELEWQYGYPFSLTLMVLVTIALIGFFRYKKWM